MSRCNSCGAPRQYDRARLTFTCLHCGTAEPAPHLSPFEIREASGLTCPSCRSALSAAKASGHAVQVCTSCAGVLAGMSAFVSVVDALRLTEGPALEALPPRTQHPGDRALSCPVCQRTMTSHLYGGGGNVVIDTCERCLHNWLDGGELRRIALAPR